jgi:chromosome segregation ATPase
MNGMSVASVDNEATLLRRVVLLMEEVATLKSENASLKESVDESNEIINSQECRMDRIKYDTIRLQHRYVGQVQQSESLRSNLRDLHARLRLLQTLQTDIKKAKRWFDEELKYRNDKTNRVVTSMRQQMTLTHQMEMKQVLMDMKSLQYQLDIRDAIIHNMSTASSLSSISSSMSSRPSSSLTVGDIVCRTTVLVTLINEHLSLGIHTIKVLVSSNFFFIIYLCQLNR